MRTIRLLRKASAVVAVLAVASALMLVAVTGQTGAEAEVAPHPTIPPVIAVPPGDAVPPTTSPAPPATTPPPIGTPPAGPPTTVPAAPQPPEPDDGALRPGATGPEVLALQQRLTDLGYWLGTPDGTYGGLTVQAVMAFQKVEGLQPDGIAGDVTSAALEAAGRPVTAASGDLVEIDKARQVLFVVRGGQVAWVLNTSTGTERPYRVNGRTELADTPPGEWKVTWVSDGWDVGELGALYRPRYFHRDGIAVHGYHSVPAYPASHGCVRVSNAAMDWIWAQDLLPLGSTVWVH